MRVAGTCYAAPPGQRKGHAWGNRGVIGECGEGGADRSGASGMQCEKNEYDGAAGSGHNILPPLRGDDAAEMTDICCGNH
jgi:hypothetical protein